MPYITPPLLLIFTLITPTEPDFRGHIYFAYFHSRLQDIAGRWYISLRHHRLIWPFRLLIFTLRHYAAITCHYAAAMAIDDASWPGHYCHAMLPLRLRWLILLMLPLSLSSWYLFRWCFRWLPLLPLRHWPFYFHAFLRWLYFLRYFRWLTPHYWYFAGFLHWYFLMTWVIIYLYLISFAEYDSHYIIFISQTGLIIALAFDIWFLSIGISSFSFSVHFSRIGIDKVQFLLTLDVI